MGAYFYQTDHLGSTTMLTDGYGNPVAGPGQSGTSYMSYYPYGEINYTESSGPDIFRYKFTGQIADSETGLYYYKSRYYDPFLGRFIQADDRADQGINGLNRYMYVGGNPVNRIDPDGHSWLSDRLKVKGFFHRAFFVSGDRWSDFGKGAGNAVQFIGAVALGPLGWGVAGVTYGLVTNGKQLLYNPSAFFSGYASGGIDYGASSILNPMEGKPMPTVERVPGGAIIRNSFYANHLMSKRYYGETRGYVTSFATGKDTYAHVLHERKHIIQNRTREGSINGEGGGIFKYFGGGKEIEADLSAGYIGYQQTAMLIRWMNYNKFISDEFYNQLINWSNFNKGY